MKAFVHTVIECLRAISRLVRSIPVAIDCHEILVVQVKRIAVRVSKAKPFGIDHGMHIHDTLQSEYFSRDDRPAVQFFGSRNCRLTASWSHAKIAPAALHCGTIVSS